MIIVDDENILRKPCEDVTPQEVNDLVKILEAELVLSEKNGRPGIGLAAPQIGMHKNIAIVRLDGLEINLINPKIIKSYDQFVFKDEGCLSFPGKLGDTLRYNEVVIEHDFGKSFVVTGLAAVVCQHEIDHLNSSLFFDRLNPIKVNEKNIKVNKRIKPNDPCPCGKINPHTKQLNKYKKCCGI